LDPHAIDMGFLSIKHSTNIGEFFNLDSLSIIPSYPFELLPIV